MCHVPEEEEEQAGGGVGEKRGPSSVSGPRVWLPDPTREGTGHPNRPRLTEAGGLPRRAWRVAD